ncbi:MAG: phosphodiester glycosidase family protein [Candidatus Levybacteria bacterium]|nr:phosphodiester glycosidase family protein [Candidatus Levybacteria bacterium]
MKFIEHGSGPLPEEILEEALLSASQQTFPSRRTRWAVGLSVPILALTIPGIGLKLSQNNKDTLAEFSRDIIGEERTQWLESQYLAFEDWKTRSMYSHGFGPDEKPFDTPIQYVNTPLVDEPPLPNPIFTPPNSYRAQEMFFEEPIIIPPEPPKKPKPFILPDTHILLSNPIAGEGSWSIDGLPTTESDLLMAKTTIRPDSARPYSNVSVIVFDSRRIRLNMVGGAIDARKGGDKGPGRVPANDLSNLLVVMNGGFQIDHARENYNSSGRFIWGAYLDGVEYAPLQLGMASVVTFKDGSIKMGAWGEGDLASRTEDMIAVRQNGALMIKDGELTPAVKKDTDLFTWGKIAATSTSFITWRSAIGMTKEGNLMIASANDMSAQSLARGLQAAGADVAMQLDINSPWVQTGIVSGHTSDGTPILSPFMNGMGNGNKFIGRPQERDFMYITRDDDSRFVP